MSKIHLMKTEKCLSQSRWSWIRWSTWNLSLRSTFSQRYLKLIEKNYFSKFKNQLQIVGLSPYVFEKREENQKLSRSISGIIYCMILYGVYLALLYLFLNDNSNNAVYNKFPEMIRLGKTIYFSTQLNKLIKFTLIKATGSTLWAGSR